MKKKEKTIDERKSYKDIINFNKSIKEIEKQKNMNQE